MVSKDGKKNLLGFSGDPGIQLIPTLGPKVCKYYLHWAIWIPKDCDRGTTMGSMVLLPGKLQEIKGFAVGFGPDKEMLRVASNLQ